jgi:hypothetical protein
MRSVNEAWGNDCIVLTFKQSSIWIIVWVCIMWGTKECLAVLDYPGGKGRVMTANRYQTQVLEAKVHDYFLQMVEERAQVIFQQGGASSHWEKSTLAWLHQMRSKLSLTQLPLPTSKTFKVLIRVRPHIPTSLKELKIPAWEACEQIVLSWLANEYLGPTLTHLIVHMHIWIVAQMIPMYVSVNY